MSENNEFENDNFFKGENEFEYYGSNQYIRPKREGFSVVSLICGLLSFFFGTMGIAGIVFGVLAVTASFLSRKKLKRFEILHKQHYIYHTFQHQNQPRYQ